MPATPKIIAARYLLTNDGKSWPLWAMALSPKHEAFAQAVVSGLSAAKAYAQIYKKATKATADTEGPKLARNPHVSLRIEALKLKTEAVATEAFGLDKGKWLADYLRIAGLAEREKDYSAAINALRQIGLAMPGWYAPEKQQVELGVSDPLAELIREVRTR